MGKTEIWALLKYPAFNFAHGKPNGLILGSSWGRIVTTVMTNVVITRPQLDPKIMPLGFSWAKLKISSNSPNIETLANYNLPTISNRKFFPLGNRGQIEISENRPALFRGPFFSPFFE